MIKVYIEHASHIFHSVKIEKCEALFCVMESVKIGHLLVFMGFSGDLRGVR